MGCSDNHENENPTYTISRKGDFYTDQQYDVIHVYGFGRNREVAEEITNSLNRSEPNTYTVRRNE